MNLRDLRYVVAVAEERHFGRAAERCHVSQPTLSGQLRKLEESLGVTLFERSSRSVAVTPLGAQIVAHARLALEQAARIEEIARARRDPMAGPLRLGVIPTVSPYLMPLVLGPLKQRCPALTPVLVEEMTAGLLERLAAHEIDAAVLATAPDAPELTSIPLFDEPFWVAYPKGHPLDALAEIAEADLAEVDLLLLTDGHCLRDQVLKVCTRPGKESGPKAEGRFADLRASSLETLLNMVAAGFGCTLVPALAVERPHPGIVARPLKLATAARPVALWYRRSFPQPRLVEALAEVIFTVLPDTVEPPPLAAGTTV
ncbi:LysR substrate-binding domain-containing protein [Pelagibius sp. CAU 1746]|uniref:LysR substrate-binding domain-containing protein n=1 Tax=Pelagibius sp. CAU 1746 TaxID=3140370 RepID=UPI00325B5C7E